MTARVKASVKAFFETGDKPTQAQFADLIDSYQDASDELTDYVTQVTAAVTATVPQRAGTGIKFALVSASNLADSSITSSKIVDGAVSTVKIASAAVTTAKIEGNNVTLAKLQQISNQRVLGNMSGGSSDVDQVIVKDEDDMASDSATALATQQSIKAYIDTQISAITGNSPYFSAYLGANQSISDSTTTILNINNETVDTNGDFDTSNYRFTPSVAGYYKFNVNVAMGSIADQGRFQIDIYKNGSAASSSVVLHASTASPITLSGSLSKILQANGTTDYFDARVTQVTGGSKDALAGDAFTCFEAFKIY
jgi:hypothetical protein